MSNTNHTPIHHIIAKHQGVSDDPPAKTSFHIPHSKESEPRPQATPEPWTLHEVVEHEEIGEELQDHVEMVKSPEIPPDIEAAGVQTVADPVMFPAQKPLKLPISDDKIVSGLHAPVTSSWRWLATLMVLMLRQAHLSLKKVHGKIVRVETR
jgi:hypothetical protein